MAVPLVLRCRLVLVGDTTVGKTSIAQVFKGSSTAFPKNYTMTIGIDLSVKKVTIPDSNTVVEMYTVDCGGFSAVCEDLLKPHWEAANAVMLVYDASSPETFENLSTWYDRITQSRTHGAITGVVIANKTDLADERPGSVEQAMGQEFAKNHGLEFFETCAANGQVEEPFQFLAQVFASKYAERKEQLADVR